MIRGGNAKEIVSRVKARVAEINKNKMLPGGLQINSFYDRTDLVDSALWTVGKVLIEGILLVVVILFIFLGNVRSSLIVVATLVITPLTTFILMNRYGISANLMSLGGLAIAIGLMVDATVVVVENVVQHLGHDPASGKLPRLHVVFRAVREVAGPITVGIVIIILVFLPLLTLQGFEGKLFAPVALTRALVPGMRARKRGHIVMISSIAGRIGAPERTGYSAAKFALAGFTEAARAELWRDGLKFTAVYPGYVQTQISMNAVKGDGRANGVTDHNIAGGISAEDCADAIWDAVETDEEEVMMGGKEVFYERFKRYAPQLFSFALKRMAPKG